MVGLRQGTLRPLAIALLLATAGVAAAAQDLGSEQQRAEGKELYDKFCAQCHGITGDGQGYATPRTKPEPRDFTRGKYKFRTTPSGMLPTDDDIRQVIRNGLPYTSMPAWPKDEWPGFTDQQVQNIIYHLKTFSEEFNNPESYAPPITISEPPPVTEESIARGREVYEAQGCKACHGELGRGDGLSAPLLKDDWGNHIRPADMTMPWTYRGGSSRKDIYRTFSTGLYGTPMPSYYDSVSEEDRWALVNYIDSLSGSEDPDYANLLLVEFVDDEIDLANAEALFAEAPEARFPLVGQIMEPGRNFHPSTTSIRVQAVYNRTEILFRLRWNDMRAEQGGSNGPALVVPPWDEDNPAVESVEEEEEGDDFWGDAAEEEPEDEGDFWGDAAEDEDDFWGEDEDEGGAGPADAGFSDAVAMQLPTRIPGGIVKPYFIFGDTENSVDLWFVDLARADVAQQLVGRGSESLTPAETDEFEVVSSYDRGEWTVLIKRALRSSSNVTFQANQYVPVAFSVWDGFNRERGNKRALSAWMYLYVQPSETVSATGPMVRIAIIVLVIELLVILFLNRQFGKRRRESHSAGEAVPQQG